jgi:hypothetical protein
LIKITRVEMAMEASNVVRAQARVVWNRLSRLRFHPCTEGGSLLPHGQALCSPIWSQGTVSGPLFFFIHVSSLAKRLEEVGVITGLRNHAFVDDLTIWARATSLDELPTIVQQGLPIIHAWAVEFGMPFSQGNHILPPSRRLLVAPSATPLRGPAPDQDVR